MLNQLIISLTLILFCVNAFATETEKNNKQPKRTENKQPKKTENEQPKKTEQDNSKPQTEPRESLRETIGKLITRRTTEKELPDFQKIDALNDNNYCFIDSSWLVLGRTEANQTVTLEIFARDNPEQEVKRDWLAGEAFMTWPMDAFPVKDGAVYLVSINNEPHNLTLHQVTTDPRTINDLSKFYEKKWEKCQRQLLILKDKKNY
jgi:hypothetical protein